ncbi:MAG: methyltransferase domain-containing protein [bacterium]|nr:methyltransferase domain-containing protein [bacterium]
MDERYTHGHFGTVVDSHAERTAANSAAFLLPHLQSTDVVLDVGCGPGSITLDLAEWVGSIVGVDAAPEAIVRSDHENARRGINNAHFQIASAYELPFDDASFDIVYAHQLLQHLAEPVAALREARRVLKPGAILAVRDADYGTMVHDPHEPAIDRWLELYQELARSNGGEPNAGRLLARWVSEAGFVDITSSTSTWTYTTPAAVESWRLLWTSRLLEARMGKDMVSKAMATGEQVANLAAGWDRWAEAPLPFFAFLHGEVLARREH